MSSDAAEATPVEEDGALEVGEQPAADAEDLGDMPDSMPLETEEEANLASELGIDLGLEEVGGVDLEDVGFQEGEGEQEQEQGQGQELADELGMFAEDGDGGQEEDQLGVGMSEEAGEHGLPEELGLPDELGLAAEPAKEDCLPQDIGTGGDASISPSVEAASLPPQQEAQLSASQQQHHQPPQAFSNSPVTFEASPQMQLFIKNVWTGTWAASVDFRSGQEVLGLNGIRCSARVARAFQVELLKPGLTFQEAPGTSVSSTQPENVSATSPDDFEAQQESEAAVRLQAAFRGKQSRRRTLDEKNFAVSASSACLSPGIVLEAGPAVQELGLEFNFIPPERITITRVPPNSAAEAAGLRPQMTISALNGKSCVQIALRAFESLMGARPLRFEVTTAAQAQAQAQAQAKAQAAKPKKPPSADASAAAKGSTAPDKPIVSRAPAVPASKYREIGSPESPRWVDDSDDLAHAVAEEQRQHQTTKARFAPPDRRPIGEAEEEVWSGMALRVRRSSQQDCLAPVGGSSDGSPSPTSRSIDPRSPESLQPRSEITELETMDEWMAGEEEEEEEWAATHIQAAWRGHKIREALDALAEAPEEIVLAGFARPEFNGRYILRNDSSDGLINGEPSYLHQTSSLLLYYSIGQKEEWRIALVDLSTMRRLHAVARAPRGKQFGIPSVDRWEERERGTRSWTPSEAAHVKDVLLPSDWTMRLLNLDYQSFANNDELIEDVMDTIADSIAFQIGCGVAPADIVVKLVECNDLSRRNPRLGRGPAVEVRTQIKPPEDMTLSELMFEVVPPTEWDIVLAARLAKLIGKHVPSVAVGQLAVQNVSAGRRAIPRDNGLAPKDIFQTGRHGASLSPTELAASASASSIMESRTQWPPHGSPMPMWCASLGTSNSCGNFHERSGTLSTSSRMLSKGSPSSCCSSPSPGLRTVPSAGSLGSSKAGIRVAKPNLPGWMSPPQSHRATSQLNTSASHSQHTMASTYGTSLATTATTLMMSSTLNSSPSHTYNYNTNSTNSLCYTPNPTTMMTSSSSKTLLLNHRGCSTKGLAPASKSASASPSQPAGNPSRRQLHGRNGCTTASVAVTTSSRGGGGGGGGGGGTTRSPQHLHARSHPATTCTRSRILGPGDDRQSKITYGSPLSTTTLAFGLSQASSPHLMPWR